MTARDKEEKEEDKKAKRPAKKPKLTALVSFMADSDDEEGEDDEEEDVPIEKLAAKEKSAMEEVHTYLSLPQSPHSSPSGVEFDLLEWWKTHAHMFPNLSRMARQYLALPASSAGVERLFSAAGRMHDAFRKNTKESTLEQQLTVFQNS